MSHWSDQFLGLSYSEDENQCFQFAARVQTEIFHRLLDWPVIWDYRSRARYIEAEKDNYTEVTTQPADGDLAIMSDRLRPAHAGIVAYLKDRLYVVHAIDGAGVVRTLARELQATCGLHLLEYRAWKI